MLSEGWGPVIASAPTPPVSAPPARRSLLDSLHRVRLTTWFLLIGGGLGLLLVFAVPPAQGIDEPNHFSRVWTLTDGALLAPARGPHQVVWIFPAAGVAPSQRVRRGVRRAGGLVPACVQRYLSTLYADGASPGHFSLAEAWRTPAHCADQPARFVAFENTALESPVAYLPQVIGVGVLRAVRAPLPLIFFGGRLAGLLGYLLMVWLAIGLAPRGRAVLFVVGAMPMALQEAAAYSADTMTIGLALLAVALALRCCLDPTTGRRWFGLLALVVVALALTKPSYVVPAPLVFLVPASRLGLAGPRAALVKSVVVVVALAAAAGWNLAIHDVSLAAYFPPHAIDPGRQLSFIAHHTISYLGIVARSLGKGFEAGGWLSGFVSSVGFYPVGPSPVPPEWVVFVALAVLLAAYATELGPRLRRTGGSNTPGPAAVGLPVALFVVGVLAVLTTLWIEWTAVGSSTVNGLQGRYLLPLAAVPMVSLVLATKEGRPVRATWIALGMVVLAIAEVAVVLGTFY
jgi:uncharacterized membrane protein